MSNNNRSFWAKIRNYFLTGILVTAPAAITFYVAFILVQAIDKRVKHWIPEQYNPENYLPFAVPGLGVILLTVILILIGMFAAGFVGRFLVKIWDKILQNTPFVSGIYSALKQIFETVLSNKSQAFRQVVMIEYPRKGLWTLAFLTGSPPLEVQNHAGPEGEEIVSIFVPTTPNPTSGFLLFVAKKDVKPMAMSVESGLKLVISTGIVNPDSTPKKQRVEETTHHNMP